jgi:hypothetical protein
MDSIDNKTTLYTSIIVSVITAILTSLLNYFVWYNQNLTTQEQNLLENKILLFEKFSNASAKMIYYSEFMMRIKIEQYKLERNYADSLAKTNGKIKIDTLPYQVRLKNQIILEKRFPLEYSIFMKGLEYQGDFISSVVTTQIVFGDSVKSDINNFNSYFTEYYVQNKVKEEMEHKKIDIYDVNDDHIITVALNEKNNLLSGILGSMYNEIKSK